MMPPSSCATTSGMGFWVAEDQVNESVSAREHDLCLPFMVSYSTVATVADSDAAAR